MFTKRSDVIFSHCCHLFAFASCGFLCPKFAEIKLGSEKKMLVSWFLKLIQEEYENVWHNKPSFEKCINVSTGANLMTCTEKSSDQVRAGNVLFFSNCSETMNFSTQPFPSILYLDRVDGPLVQALWRLANGLFSYIIYSIFLIDSYDINDMDYHWDDAQALIILDDEMSEFELADAQIERKLVEYVIGIIYTTGFVRSKLFINIH